MQPSLTVGFACMSCTPVWHLRQLKLLRAASSAVWCIRSSPGFGSCAATVAQREMQSKATKRIVQLRIILQFPLIRQSQIAKSGDERVDFTANRGIQVVESGARNQHRNTADEDDVVIEQRPVFDAGAQIRA